MGKTDRDGGVEGNAVGKMYTALQWSRVELLEIRVDYCNEKGKTKVFI